MLTRKEFIENHWEEALVIDAKMREAAVACVKNFLGEDQILSSLLRKEDLIASNRAITYFSLLAYRYSLKALDLRVLKMRSFIEGLFQLVILQSAVGNESAAIVARVDYAEFSISKARLGNKAIGADRVQAGIEQIRMIYRLFKALPTSYDEMESHAREFPRRSVKELWIGMWRKSKTEAKSSEQKEFQGESIQLEIARICDVWHIQRESSMDMEGWLLEEIESNP